MKKEHLDCVLVPVGLCLMFSYHVWLLYRIKRHPKTTVMGINAINRMIWVKAMTDDSAKNGILAVQTLRNNIMASTLLSTMAIMLSSVIAVLMTSSAVGLSSSENTSTYGGGFIYGNRSKLGLSVKFFSILICFLTAFLLNVQSVRYFSHSGILINVPLKDHSPTLTPEYVGGIVNRGSYFWSLGLRAIYFSFPLFLWIFGPIPMLVCCVLMVVLLYFLDITSESKLSADIQNVEREEGTTTINMEGRSPEMLAA